MAQTSTIEDKVRKLYRNTAKNGANPIKEKTLNKHLLALYPENATELPDIVARILSEEEAARQQQQASPDPIAANSGGVPLAVESAPAPTSEPSQTPNGTHDSTKISKNAAKKAKKAEKAQRDQDAVPAVTPSESHPETSQHSEKPSKGALKRAKKAEKAQQRLQQQQQENSQQQEGAQIGQPADPNASESPAPGQDVSQSPAKLSKKAAKRAKKAEKALQKSQKQEQDGSEQIQTPNAVSGPPESPAPENETAQNPVKPSKAAIKRAKKAEKAYQKSQQQQQEETPQGLGNTTSAPNGVPESTPEPGPSENPGKLSKGAAKRARKAEKAMQPEQQQQGADVQPAFAPTPIPSHNEDAVPANVFSWGDEPTDSATVATEKAGKKAKQTKAKKGKKQKSQGKLPVLENGKVSLNGDSSFDWAEDRETHDEVFREAPANSKVKELTAYIGAPIENGHKSPNLSVLDRQLELLGLDGTTPESETHAINDTQEAVLFSADLLDRAPGRVAPQYALLGGSTPDPDSMIDPSSRRMFMNSNIPFSAFICGVQGSGKSHTTSCLIENCMIKSSSLGVLKKPLSTLVLHLGEHSSSLNLRPSEAAFLSSPGRGMLDDYSQVSVTVLTSPSNYPNLRALYSQMPNVEIRPFMLQPKHLNIGTMLTLMSVDKTQNAPLYMGQVTKILREMASQATGDFDYLDFRRRLENSNLDSRQVEYLNQRLDLLESFLDLKGKVKEPNFEAGKVTIIDLSCPFVDSNTACVLFNIGLGMFLQTDLSSGKVIVVDEAHKYMTDTPAAKQLTETLLAIIRQQRHYGVRVIISTQEPTINPRLIDLCSVTVIHRFFSPEWFNALRKHIAPGHSINSNNNNRSGRNSRSRRNSRGWSGQSALTQSNGVEVGGEGDVDRYGWDSDESDDGAMSLELFRSISGLRTGEALVFAPSAILGVGEGGKARKAERLFKMKMRKRVTWDGGKSMVCV